MSSSSEAGRRIRVLWLIKGLGPGGAEMLLANMAAVRDRDRFDYEIAYLLPWKDHLVPRFMDLDVPVHCLEGGAPHDLRWVGRLRRLQRHHRFDVVHVHSPLVAGFARPALKSLPTTCRPKIVTTEHHEWSRYAPPTRLLNALSYPLDSGQFVVSEKALASIPRRMARRAQTLTHGVVVEEVHKRRADRAMIRAELGLGDDEPLVVTIANYKKEKDYPNLLAAAQQVVASDDRVRFAAVGQGHLQAEVEAAHGASGLGDRFRLLGYREDAQSVLAAADVFVLASRDEGLPVVLMEALALGAPVVTTAVGGVTQMVDHGVHGLLVPAADPGALAAAISKLVGDPGLRDAMSTAGQERARMFDIGTAAAVGERLYRSITARSGS